MKRKQNEFHTNDGPYGYGAEVAVFGWIWQYENNIFNDDISLIFRLHIK